MVEEKVDPKSFFPNSEMSPVDKTGWNPSMQGAGLDPVELPREKTPIYGGKEAGVDSMLIRDVPVFVQRRLESAAQLGDLHATLAHYAAALDGADVLDRTSARKLRALAEEAKENAGVEGNKEILEKVVKILRGLRCERR